MNRQQPICDACGQPVLMQAELPPLPPTKQRILAVYDSVQESVQKNCDAPCGRMIRMAGPKTASACTCTCHN